MIIAFALFYVTVTFNTDELAENLQKQGAFIKGMRPGKDTAEYLRKVSFKLTAIGALFLGVLAVLPNVLKTLGVIQIAIVSGTGFLIIVGTILQIKREIEALAVTRNYDEYL